MPFEDSEHPERGLPSELTVLREQLEKICPCNTEQSIQLHSSTPELQSLENTLNEHFLQWRLQLKECQQEKDALALELFKHSALINNIPDIAWFKDVNSIYTIVNDAIVKASGIDAKAMQGKTDFDFWPADLAEQYRKDDQLVIETGRQCQVEERFQGVEGGLKWIETIKTPVLDQAGHLIGTVGIARDITRRKQVEEENRQLTLDLEKRVEERTAQLRQVNAALQRSNEDLENFATIASHDLQNPLRKVMMFSEHLKSSALEKLSEEELDDINRLQAATQKMQSLIEDLLALSRVTRRGKPFQKTDLSQVMNEVLAELHTSREREGTVKVEKLPIIEADPAQMRQLLLQLVENGLKFRQENKKPVVSISVLPSGDERYCRICIQDNGIGITAENFQKVFDPFVRCHNIRKYPGTGIGLSIAQKIVERHHGWIEIQSQIGQGSTFTVVLPTEQKLVP